MTELPPLLLAADPFIDPTPVELPAVAVAALRFTGLTIADLGGAFDSGYSRLSQEGPIGPGYAIYDGDPSQTFDLEIGFPVAVPPTADDVLATEFPAGTALALSHLGSFEDLGTTWGRFVDLAVESGHGLADRAIEIYVTDPSTVKDPADLRTDLILLLAD